MFESYWPSTGCSGDTCPSAAVSIPVLGGLPPCLEKKKMISHETPLTHTTWTLSFNSGQIWAHLHVIRKSNLMELHEATRVRKSPLQIECNGPGQALCEVPRAS